MFDFLSQWITRLNGIWNRVRQGAVPSIVAAVLIVATIGATHQFLRKKFNDLVAPAIHDLNAADAVATSDLESLVHDRAKRCERCNITLNYLTAQHAIMHQLKKHHLRIAHLFFQTYYASAMVATFSSILVALFGLTIAKKGWDAVSGWVRTATLGFSFSASICIAIIQVFDLEVNARSNMGCYFQFERFQGETRSRLVTFHCDDTTDCEDLAQFAAEQNSAIQATRQIFFSIKAGEMPQLIWPDE